MWMSAGECQDVARTVWTQWAASTVPVVLAMSSCQINAPVQVYSCVRACVCVCVRACMRVCMRVCGREGERENCMFKTLTNLFSSKYKC